MKYLLLLLICFGLFACKNGNTKASLEMHGTTIYFPKDSFRISIDNSDRTHIVCTNEGAEVDMEFKRGSVNGQSPTVSIKYKGKITASSASSDIIARVPSDKSYINIKGKSTPKENVSFEVDFDNFGKD